MPSWWDRFGQEWANQGVTDDPTFAQADAGWAFIGQAPPTVEQFNSVMQWTDDKDNWLYGQIANCIIGANMVPDANDLTQLWNAIKSLQRHKLTQDTSYYIDAVNGNDVTGTGAVGSPWKTIQFAINNLYTNVDLAGHVAVIQLAPGTYAPFYHNQSINGALVVQGDPLNPRAYIIKAQGATNAVSVQITAGAFIYLKGFSIESTSQAVPGNPYTSFGYGLMLDRAAAIVYDALAFGPCSGYQLYSGISGEFYPWNGLATTYLIYGGAYSHMYAAAGGYLVNGFLTVTIQNNPTFNYFYIATGAAQILAQHTIYNGTAIGTKYNVALGGLLYTEGTYANIPGTVAGVVDTASFGILN